LAPRFLQYLRAHIQKGPIFARVRHTQSIVAFYMKNISGKDSFFLSVFLSSPSSQFNQPFDCVTQEEEEEEEKS
jgi:hypothetical protein